MHQVPEIHHQAAQTGIRVEENPDGLALRSMEAQHGRATQKILTWGTYTPLGDGQKVHQVDGSGAHHELDGHVSSELHQVDHLPLWDPS